MDIQEMRKDVQAELESIEADLTAKRTQRANLNVEIKQLVEQQRETASILARLTPRTRTTKAAAAPVAQETPLETGV